MTFRGDLPVTDAVLLQNVSKSFGPVQALTDVSLRLESGEVRALVGENGAGKTTLMNILYGMMKPDCGRIHVGGVETGAGWSPREAMRRGLGMLHQHFSLVQAHTVLENVLMPALTWANVRPPWRKYRQEVERLCEQYRFSLKLDAVLGSLAVGQQQQVEILKLLYQGARILILDEPTSVLTPQQTRGLLDLLLVLKQQGHTVVLITHKLPEAMAVADAITVLRGGRVMVTVPRRETTPEQLAGLMVNRDIADFGLEYVETRSPDRFSGEPLLKVRNLVVGREAGRAVVDAVSLDVRGGEVVGLAGVAGNGQIELAQAIAGIAPVRGGAVALGGHDVTRHTVRSRKALGLGFISEDRIEDAIFPELSVRDNVTLELLSTPPLSRLGFLEMAEVGRTADAAMAEYDVRAAGSEAPMNTLSGGNQQKVVLARIFAGRPKVIVACQPTRGLDFSATRFVQDKLWAAAQQGVGVLLISSELDELLALSHRILVMFRGRVVGEFARGAFDVERIGLLMTGQGQESSTAS